MENLSPEEKTGVDKRFDLMVRNLQEISLDVDLNKKIMAARPLSIYWGTAPTGKPHIGYYVPLMKIKDFVDAGCVVKILIADLHAFLDNLKTPFDLIKARSEYYILIIKKMLTFLEVDLSKIQFVRGTDFQLSDKYTVSLYKMLANTKLTEIKHAGAEVVKQSDNPLVTNLIYPALQALDEEFLGVDIQFGGIDQRKIFMFAKLKLPTLKFRKRGHLMNPMIPGLRFKKQEEKIDPEEVKKESAQNIQPLTKEELLDSEKVQEYIRSLQMHHKVLEGNVQESKMSSTNLDSKIDMLDSKGQIKKKINSAYCLPGDIDDNSPLELLENLIFPILKIKQMDFIVRRKQEYGGDILYKDINQVKEDFKNEKLHPGDLKPGIIEALDMMVSSIRKAFENKEMKQLLKKAYS